MLQASPPRLEPAQIRTILIGVVVAMFLAALDQTIVATALPTIGRELNDVQSLAWVVTAYLLTATAVTPLYGKLSDIHGRRAMLLIAIAIFLIGSLLCAISRDIYLLIAARGLQGLGGGGLISLGQTIVGDIVAPRERGRYQAYFSGLFVTASIVGPVLGGFFAEEFHWSLIFWINLPLGALALWMTNRVLKILPRHDRKHQLDILGAVLMVVATVALMLALTWGGTTYAWGSAEILTLLALSAIGWVLFVFRLMRAPEPFIPLGVLSDPVVGYGLFAMFFAMGNTIGLTVFVPLYFEAVVGLSAAQSGLALIAYMGGSVAGATLAGRIMLHAAHYKRAAVIGQALGAAGMLVAAIWPRLPLVWMDMVLAVAGMGVGTIFPVTTTAVQNAVPAHQLGTATGALNFIRSLGSAILVAGFSAIFLAAVAATGGVSVQKVVAQGAAAATDFAPAFSGVFLASCIACLMSLIGMIAMREVPLRGHPTAGSGEAG